MRWRQRRRGQRRRWKSQPPPGGSALLVVRLVSLPPPPSDVTVQHVLVPLSNLAQGYGTHQCLPTPAYPPPAQTCLFALGIGNPPLSTSRLHVTQCHTCCVLLLRTVQIQLWCMQRCHFLCRPHSTELLSPLAGCACLAVTACQRQRAVGEPTRSCVCYSPAVAASAAGVARNPQFVGFMGHSCR